MPFRHHRRYWFVCSLRHVKCTTTRSQIWRDECRAVGFTQFLYRHCRPRSWCMICATEDWERSVCLNIWHVAFCGWPSSTATITTFSYAFTHFGMLLPCHRLCFHSLLSTVSSLSLSSPVFTLYPKYSANSLHKPYPWPTSISNSTAKSIMYFGICRIDSSHMIIHITRKYYCLIQWKNQVAETLGLSFFPKWETYTEKSFNILSPTTNLTTTILSLYLSICTTWSTHCSATNTPTPSVFSDIHTKTTYNPRPSISSPVHKQQWLIYYLTISAVDVLHLSNNPCSTH